MPTSGRTAGTAGKLSKTMKTKPKTQCEELARYLNKHRSKGITTLEAAIELGICCLHKRMGELEDPASYYNYKRNLPGLKIDRIDENSNGSTRTRYKLAR